MKFFNIQNDADRAALEAYLAGQSAPFEVAVTPGAVKHSRQQRKYLEVLLDFLALETGAGGTRAERRQFREALLGEIVGEISTAAGGTERRSTAPASAAVLGEIIEIVLKHAADLGIVVPPDERLMLLAVNDPRYNLARPPPENANGN